MTRQKSQKLKNTQEMERRIFFGEMEWKQWQTGNRIIY